MTEHVLLNIEDIKLCDILLNNIKEYIHREKIILFHIEYELANVVFCIEHKKILYLLSKILEVYNNHEMYEQSKEVQLMIESLT